MSALTKKLRPYILILFAVILAFFPIFQKKIPLNGRNLVSFFSPWIYEKYPGFPAGVPAKPGMLDPLRQFYPYLSLTQKEYRAGRLPLWNPYNFAGNPHQAEWQSAIYYPFHLLLLVLPLPVYWTIYQMIGFTLSASFTFIFLKKQKLKIIPALFGALTFSFGGFMSAWNMGVTAAPHTVAWLPLALVSVENFLNGHSKHRKLWWLTGIISLSLSVLAGFWQTTFYVMLSVFLFQIYRLRSQKQSSKQIFALLAWFPLSMLIISFYLFPSIELFTRASRNAINNQNSYQNYLKNYLLDSKHLITLIFPDYFGHPSTRNHSSGLGGEYYEQAIYIGIIPLFLAIMAVIKKFRRSGPVRFWTLFSLISASFAFATPWGKAVYWLKIPLLSTSIPNRILFIPSFGLSFLSAFGLQELSHNNLREISKLFHRLFILFLTAVFCILSTTFVLGLLINTKIWPACITSFRNSILPFANLLSFAAIVKIYLFFKNKKLKTVILPAILILSFSEALYHHFKITSFSEIKFIFPDHPVISWLKQNAGLYRFSGYNGEFISSNFATYFEIYSPEGYDALNDRRRSQLITSSQTGNFSSSVMTSSDSTLNRNLDNPHTLKILQLMGVKYLIDHPAWPDIPSTDKLPRLPDPEQKLVFQYQDWKIWEYQKALPRALLVGNYQLLGKSQNIIQKIHNPQFQPGQMVILQSPPPPELMPVPDPAAKVTITDYQPSRIVFMTSSSQNQLLVLSDTWYPGWRAQTENGANLPVLTANYALRAVPIPSGEHTITMYFQPDSLKYGFIISLIGTLILLCLSIMLSSVP